FDYIGFGLGLIDDGLIHGLVASRWTKESFVISIIVVCVEVGGDTLRKTLLTHVAPRGFTAIVFDVAIFFRVYINPK
ncbi:PTS sugar transporter subunit IIB, partial [Salmonella enterica subsp. enterica serovar Infantis]